MKNKEKKDLKKTILYIRLDTKVSLIEAIFHPDKREGLLLKMKRIPKKQTSAESSVEALQTKLDYLRA